MSFGQTLLLRAFGRPQGLLGRFGGRIMARTNGQCAASMLALLDIQPNDCVLEVGFGPGVGIALATQKAKLVAGADSSREMLAQATARNATDIAKGRVDLRLASVEHLPFENDGFDKAFAINSMQVWPDVAAALRKIGRVLKPDGRIALGFTQHSGQEKAGLVEALKSAGFSQARLIDIEQAFCVLATKA